MAGFPQLGKTASAADVQSILAENCVKCHGPTRQKGGLRFDSRQGLLRKGDSGSPAVTPNKPAASEMIRRVTSTDASVRMPPGDARLTAAQVAILWKWIEAGAEWSGKEAASVAKRTELKVTEEDRRHWAFQPLAKVEPPAVKDAGKTRNAIDRFILAALEAKRLTPAPSANARVQIRRVTFDAIGLPPTPEEVEAFVKAANPDAAYEALVNRLLASPNYGERWGRHWLDLARYADSGGYESDIDRPTAYHYRDFVIGAFNADMPFDDFVRLQLAGDEIRPDDPLAIAATGFLTAGPGELLGDNLLQEERMRQRYIELDDMLTTTGAAFLGLTLGCARCHDHKFDPIPSRDYYQLLAALHSGSRIEAPLGSRAEIERANQARADWNKQRKAAESALKTWVDGQRAKVGPRLRAARIAKLPISDAEKSLLRDKPESAGAKALAKKHEKALSVSNDEVRKATDAAARKQWDELAQDLDAVRKRAPNALPTSLAFRDKGGKPADSWLFRRGDFHDHTIRVELGFVTVLNRGKSASDYWKEARADGRTDTTYQRRALAAWVTDAERGAGPLLARVIVNRVWQHYFGEGLVRTPNDFGVRGDRPSHPELLEWLSADLVAHGWKLKRLHRMILLSATYRQGSAFEADKAKIDPENRLLWRMRPRRLEAEVLRDALLAAGGVLNRTMFGPAFKPPIPADAMVARNLKSPYPKNVPEGPEDRRRSVYMFHKRVIPYPLFQVFDAPDAQQCVGRRNVTTVAPQGLALLNDPFIRTRAGDFAKRLLKDAGGDSAKAVDRAYCLAFGRPPTEVERRAGVEFLAQQNRERSARNPKQAPDEIRRQALTDYCQVLFGLNEFIYVD
ncbi:MAG: PSD1 and planctomycete cytochrome C domain-containing protein [Gemmataceae bacterium]